MKECRFYPKCYAAVKYGCNGTPYRWGTLRCFAYEPMEIEKVVDTPDETFSFDWQDSLARKIVDAICAKLEGMDRDKRKEAEVDSRPS